MPARVLFVGNPESVNAARKSVMLNPRMSYSVTGSRARNIDTNDTFTFIESQETDSIINRICGDWFHTIYLLPPVKDQKTAIEELQCRLRRLRGDGFPLQFFIGDKLMYHCEEAFRG